jgi:hypothetical protein
MRLRATLATLTAVLLLSIPCVASVCETSCVLKVLEADCHYPATAASHKKATPQKTGMDDCGMASTDHTVKAPSASVRSNSACNHMVCPQPSVLANNEYSTSVQLISAQYATIPNLTLPVSDWGSIFENTEAPPHRAPSLVSLQTTLRI